MQIHVLGEESGCFINKYDIGAVFEEKARNN
jgi:hypothetical protein